MELEELVQRWRKTAKKPLKHPPSSMNNPRYIRKQERRLIYELCAAELEAVLKERTAYEPT